MNSEIHIRSADSADVPAMAGLLTQLNESEGYNNVTDAEALADALFGQQREVQLQALVAVRDDTIIGTLLYYAGYDTLSASVGYHLADMVMCTNHRRQGVGRALMRALAQRTLAQNKQWVSLTALKHNEAARNFYASLGMTQVNVDFFAMGKTALMQL